MSTIGTLSSASSESSSARQGQKRSAAPLRKLGRSLNPSVASSARPAAFCASHVSDQLKRSQCWRHAVTTAPSACSSLAFSLPIRLESSHESNDGCKPILKPSLLSLRNICAIRGSAQSYDGSIRLSLNERVC